MEIMQVMGTLVCSYRVAGLDHMHLRILKNNKGKKLVAVDPVGAREGNWVFTASGSAARHACPDNTVLTDLTIGGIIDFGIRTDRDPSFPSAVSVPLPHLPIHGHSFPHPRRRTTRSTAAANKTVEVKPVASTSAPASTTAKAAPASTTRRASTTTRRSSASNTGSDGGSAVTKPLPPLPPSFQVWRWA